MRGEENWIADALSRLGIPDKSEPAAGPAVTRRLGFFFSEQRGANYRRGKLRVGRSEEEDVEGDAE